MCNNPSYKTKNPVTLCNYRKPETTKKNIKKSMQIKPIYIVGGPT